MLAEAELFLEAGRVLAEVLGRIRPEDGATPLPPVRDGDPPAHLGQAVARSEREDGQLADALGAADAGEAADRARRAAREAAPAVVPGGPDPAALLLEAAVARALLAHYVAAALGSTACPLPEELARPLWEATHDDADGWRDRGWFRPPLPLPPHVSWRDRFLRTAGHDPHPGH